MTEPGDRHAARQGLALFTGAVAGFAFLVLFNRWIAPLLLSNLSGSVAAAILRVSPAANAFCAAVGAAGMVRLAIGTRKAARIVALVATLAAGVIIAASATIALLPVLGRAASATGSDLPRSAGLFAISAAQVGGLVFDALALTVIAMTPRALGRPAGWGGAGAAFVPILVGAFLMQRFLSALWGEDVLYLPPRFFLFLDGALLATDAGLAIAALKTRALLLDSAAVSAPGG